MQIYKRSKTDRKKSRLQLLAPTLFNILFSVLLKHAFRSADESILLCTRSDGRLFNPARLRAKTKARKVMLRDLLFADDAAIVAHSEGKLQTIFDRSSNTCADMGLSISLTKTKIMCHSSEVTPGLTIKDFTLDVVSQFTYLDPTTSDNASLDTELGKRIGKAASNMAMLSSRVWKLKKLTTQTKIAVYRACIVSILLCGSES